jgi:hypothetical protein
LYSLSKVNRRFGGTYHLDLQGRKISQTETYVKACGKHTPLEGTFTLSMLLKIQNTPSACMFTASCFSNRPPIVTCSCVAGMFTDLMPSNRLPLVRCYSDFQALLTEPFPSKWSYLSQYPGRTFQSVTTHGVNDRASISDRDEIFLFVSTSRVSPRSTQTYVYIRWTLVVYTAIYENHVAGE